MIAVESEANARPARHEPLEPSVLRYANLFKAGPFYVPGNNYELIREIGEHPLSRWERVKLTFLTRYHPDVARSLLIHWRAARVLRTLGAGSSKDSLDRATFEEEFGRYLEAYGGRPFVAYFKFLEGQAFRSVPQEAFGSGTLEIGVSDGTVSGLHFKGRRIEYGTEFIWQRLRQHSSVHQHVFGSDLRRLPIRDCSLRTVCLVHIFDDLSFDIGQALAELQRIIRPGGLLIFSSASKGYGCHQTHATIGRFVRMSEEDFQRYRGLRYAVRNLHSRDELQQVLARYGFELANYREFLSMDYASSWDCGMTVEMGLARTPLDYLKRTPYLMQRYRSMVMDAFFRAYCHEIVASGPGINCFCVARKA